MPEVLTGNTENQGVLCPRYREICTSCFCHQVFSEYLTFVYETFCIEFQMSINVRYRRNIFLAYDFEEEMKRMWTWTQKEKFWCLCITVLEVKCQFIATGKRRLPSPTSGFLFLLSAYLLSNFRIILNNKKYQRKHIRPPYITKLPWRYSNWGTFYVRNEIKNTYAE
jgi:hypothetical protein